MVHTTTQAEKSQPGLAHTATQAEKSHQDWLTQPRKLRSPTRCPPPAGDLGEEMLEFSLRAVAWEWEETNVASVTPRIQVDSPRAQGPVCEGGRRNCVAPASVHRS